MIPADRKDKAGKFSKLLLARIGGHRWMSWMERIKTISKVSNEGQKTLAGDRIRRDENVNIKNPV